MSEIYTIKKGGEIQNIKVVRISQDYRIYLSTLEGTLSNWKVTSGRSWQTRAAAKKFLEDKGWKFQ